MDGKTALPEVVFLHRAEATRRTQADISVPTKRAGAISRAGVLSMGHKLLMDKDRALAHAAVILAADRVTTRARTDVHRFAKGSDRSSGDHRAVIAVGRIDAPRSARETDRSRTGHKQQVAIRVEGKVVTLHSRTDVHRSATRIDRLRVVLWVRGITNKSAKNG